MRKILVLVLVSITILDLNSQRKELMLVPFEQNGLWGYMNSEKKIIVEPQYDAAYLTLNLMGRVKKNGKYGYINNEGQLIIKLKYDSAEDFRSGIAQVHKGNRSFFIKSNGKKNKILIAYCRTHPHFNSPIRVNDSLIQTNRYNSSEKEILKILKSKVSTLYDIDNNAFIAENSGKIAITKELSSNKNPDSIISHIHFEYDSIKIFPCRYDDGGITNYFGISTNNYWGYYFFTEDPILIIRPKYLNIESFENEFAKVEFEPNRFGYIDLQGNEYFFRIE